MRRGLVSRDSIVNRHWLLATVSLICHAVNPRPTSQKLEGGFLYGVYKPGKCV